MFRAITLIPGNNPIVAVWFAVNVLDSLLTCIALSMGAVEISLSYQMTHSLLISMGLKYIAVMLIVDIIVQIKRLHWLNWFVAGMIFVLSWNMSQIASNIR